MFDSGTTYTLTGTQLSGLINGGDEGDDMTMAENYPIVWLKDASSNVYFCKSFNFSNMMPSKGDAPETCQFTTPAGLAQGTYNLYVIGGRRSFQERPGLYRGCGRHRRRRYHRQR